MAVDPVWLTAPDLRVRVGPAGVLLGRDPGCDVVLADPTASRHHALVRLGPHGPRVQALGRRPLLVNGAPVAARPLRDGDRLELPGLALDVRVDGSGGSPEWLVGRPGGPRLRVGDRLVLGAGADVAPDGWPEDALALVPLGERLVATGRVGWLRNGVAQEPHRDVALNPGDLFGLEPGLDGRAFAVERASDEVAATGLAGDLPERVELRWLTRGGRLQVGVAGDDRTVWVPERRFALLVSLLDPAAPLAPGDDIPDEQVLARVWPRQPHKSRVDLNVLVGRLRGDLEPAGLSPTWVARSEGGGATRFRLAPGAAVEVG